ncbi:MAG: MBL fold metallo-hydrolase [Ruminococcaceae bacterium]|nr:MBL fold metallo-hydrolase [Oscillospiraceae bacterium]
MEIKTIVLGGIGTNCYLISSDNAAIVIDPGFECQEAAEFLNVNNLKERLILLTHCHFDHIGFAKDLSEKTNTKIAIGELDAEGLNDNNVNLSNLFGLPLKNFNADIELKDKSILKVGDIEINVIHTPGHTIGGSCYLIDDVLFAGDTLFCESIGRTDFPGGDFGVLNASIKKLFSLPDETVVYSGHGPITTIAHEKLYNPFIR